MKSLLFMKIGISYKKEIANPFIIGLVSCVVIFLFLDLPKSIWGFLWLNHKDDRNFTSILIKWTSKEKEWQREMSMNSCLRGFELSVLSSSSLHWPEFTVSCVMTGRLLALWWILILSNFHCSVYSLLLLTEEFFSSVSIPSPSVLICIFL